MIVYLDTSALLKLYVDEPGSSIVREVTEAQTSFTQIIAYAELRAALAKALRMERISTSSYGRLLGQVESDWDRLNLVNVEMPLVRRAGEMAEQFNLRGFDSLHLAAAEWLADTVGISLRFACFDDRLNHAAAEIGLQSAI